MDWLNELAIIDREWRQDGKYGKHLSKRVSDLIEMKPIQVTDVLLKPSMYSIKFGITKRTT